MPIEIERKFLVIGDRWRTLGTPIRYCQGYLAASEKRTVRVRVAGSHAYLTIKGTTVGIARAEYEYEIPLQDAEEMLELCDRPLISKTRTQISWQGLIWEVDEFFEENQGLVLAEVELKNENQVIDRPDWIGQEVSDDPRYYNANLAKHPFTQW
jgi:adenylate cyclase